MAYKDKIPPLHRKPKFTATVEAVTVPLVALQQKLRGFISDYDLDTAIGAQLDVVGGLVGVTRAVSVPIDNRFFSFGGAFTGWGDGVWRGTFDELFGQITLDDPTFRRLIQARIRLNNWDGTIGEARGIINAFFGVVETVIVVNEQINPTPYENLFSWGIVGRGWGQGTWNVPNLQTGVNLIYNSATRVFIEDLGWAPEHVDSFQWGVPGVGWGEGGWGKPDAAEPSLGYRVAIAGSLPAVAEMQLLVSGSLTLKAAGMPVEFCVTSVPDGPIFGFGANNEHIGGWGRGAWSQPIETFINT